MSLKKIKKITEEYYNTVEPYDEPVDIFKNPSTLELGKLWNEKKIVRGWVDGNDVYVWDGDSATHYDVKLDGEYRIFIEADRTLGVYSEEDEYDSNLEEEIENNLKRCSNIKSLLRFTDNDIKVIFGGYDAGENWK